MLFAPCDPGFGHRVDPATTGKGYGIGPGEGSERGEPMIGPLLELTEHERHHRRSQRDANRPASVVSSSKLEEIVA